MDDEIQRLKRAAYEGGFLEAVVLVMGYQRAGFELDENVKPIIERAFLTKAPVLFSPCLYMVASSGEPEVPRAVETVPTIVVPEERPPILGRPRREMITDRHYYPSTGRFPGSPDH